MIRKGPGITAGIDETLSILHKYAFLESGKDAVWALRDGEHYGAGETQLVIEAPIQKLIGLETMYLGVLSRATTMRNEPGAAVDLRSVIMRVSKIRNLIGSRELVYMGARHWDFREDSRIACAVYAAGANATSTGIGSIHFDRPAVGTIPHVLENIFAWAYGRDQAVARATVGFDQTIEKQIPRIALIDYRNHEIDDAIATFNQLGSTLAGVRCDTCGENIPQGGSATFDELHELILKPRGIPCTKGESAFNYWHGTGVTVSGVLALREKLDAIGASAVKIWLSSGFANPLKVLAFVDAEKTLGIRLFDGLGVGALFHSRAAKMDIVAAGADRLNLHAISKTGRSYQPNNRLQQVF